MKSMSDGTQPNRSTYRISWQSKRGDAVALLLHKQGKGKNSPKSFRLLNLVTTTISEERDHIGDGILGARSTGESGCRIVRIVPIGVTGHDRRVKVASYDAVRIPILDVRSRGFVP